MSTLILLLSSLATAAAPSLSVHPRTLAPGDPVLIELNGLADAKQPPVVRLGDRELPVYPTRRGWSAIGALPIEQPEGDLEVSAADQKETLRVVARDFDRVELEVEEFFVDPPAELQPRIAEDKKAVEAAYDQKYTPLMTTRSFMLPKHGKVTSAFGQLRMFNEQLNSQHFGTDLTANTGDTVRASNDGEVVLVRDCFYSGKTVIVHHGAQVYTTYFHLSSTAVEKGQHVRRGQKLGEAGETGRTTAPHVHFGVRVRDRYVDPLVFLKLRLPLSIKRAAPSA